MLLLVWRHSPLCRVARMRFSWAMAIKAYDVNASVCGVVLRINGSACLIQGFMSWCGAGIREG